jgi:hypothetical protein
LPAAFGDGSDIAGRYGKGRSGFHGAHGARSPSDEGEFPADLKVSKKLKAGPNNTVLLFLLCDRSFFI